MKGCYLQASVDIHIVGFFYHGVTGALTRYLGKLEVQSAITYGMGKNNSPALELVGKNVA